MVEISVTIHKTCIYKMKLLLVCSSFCKMIVFRKVPTYMNSHYYQNVSTQKSVHMYKKSQLPKCLYSEKYQHI